MLVFADDIFDAAQLGPADAIEDDRLPALTLLALRSGGFVEDDIAQQPTISFFDHFAFCIWGHTAGIAFIIKPVQTSCRPVDLPFIITRSRLTKRQGLLEPARCLDGLDDEGQNALPYVPQVRNAK